MGKKAKERQKREYGYGKEREKMGKDECQIGANLRDDNALYYNNAILATVTYFSCISI